MSFPWADTHITALRAFRDQGMSYGAVAQAMNAKYGTKYSRSAIIGKASRMKLPSNAPVAAMGGFTRRMRHSANGKANAVRKARKGIYRSPMAVVYAPPPPKITVLPPTNPFIRLADIGLFQCRYIKGDPCGPDSLMCGAAVAGEGRSYCDYHAAICFVPWVPPKRRSSIIPQHRQQETGE